MPGPFHPYAALYATHSGPRDQRPTALQVVKDNDLLDKWSGKVALVTGGTSGIRIKTDVAVHATGADLYFTARDLKKDDATSSEILGRTTGKGRLEVIQLDLDSLDSVRHAAKDFLAKSSALNILINNAGTHFLVPFPFLRAAPWPQQES